MKAHVCLVWVNRVDFAVFRASPLPPQLQSLACIAASDARSGEIADSLHVSSEEKLTSAQVGRINRSRESDWDQLSPLRLNKQKSIVVADWSARGAIKRRSARSISSLLLPTNQTTGSAAPESVSGHPLTSIRRPLVSYAESPHMPRTDHLL